MRERSSLSTMQCLAFLVASAMLLSGCLGLGRFGVPAYELGVEAAPDYGVILNTYDDG